MDACTPDPISELTDDPKLLKAMLRDMTQRLEERERRIETLLHRLDQLLRRTFGHRAETVDVNQLRLAFADVARETESDTEAAAPPTEGTADGSAERAVKEAFLGPPPDPATIKPHRKGHGRRRLPEHLRRERIEQTLSESELACPECGRTREKIGEEVSEKLDYVPAALVVRQTVRFKYACRCCQEHVAIAPAPAQSIEKGLPGPGLLAQVLVGKFADHCPLHRQAGILQRHGVRLSPSTLGDWVRDGATVLEPVVHEMKRAILGSHVIQSDDTPVPVLDRGRDHTRQGRLWVYRGDDAHAYTIYEYTPDRAGKHPRGFLEQFRGYLQADAYAGYDALYKPDPLTGKARILEIACWAHCRRGFFDAQTSDQLRSLIALSFIKLLYRVEEEARGLDPPARRALRHAKAKPWLGEFKVWLESQQREVLPKSPFGEATHYALAQWAALERYLDDGRLEIDNNGAERALRGVAVGRANWHFAGSDAGGERAAVIYSVVESARRHGLDPFAYLRDLLDRLPTHPQTRMAELLPDRWKTPITA
jgi:transposase